MITSHKNNSLEEFINGGELFTALSQVEQKKQLSSAISENQFSIYLQPKIKLSDWSIRGAELLLRWQHPEYGLLLPEQFILPLEKSGLMGQLGPRMLQTACQLQQDWQQAGMEPLLLAINLSCSQVQDDSFHEHIDEIFYQSAMDTGFLEFEIDDACLFDNSDSQLNTLQKIRAKGIKLAIKYSLSGFPDNIDLDRLPIDIINMDRELTQQISSNQDSRQIMATILDFAHKHDMQVVAEGIETAEQLIFLNAMHCNTAQGFFLSPPLSINKFSELYKSGKRFDGLIEKVSRRW